MEESQCLVCAEPCRFFGVFDCSHGVCGICAVRMFTITKKGCPVCRHESKELIVTRDAPSQGEYTFDIKSLKQRKSAMIYNRALGVRVDGVDLNDCIDKLHQYVCPSMECWKDGEQQPFRHKDSLREHLSSEHKVDYCSICLDHRPVFMSEQQTYGDKERDAHNRGECPRDPDSFVGHPMCYFCNRRFYDGEHLLKHLQQQHYSCDLCNRGEYTFTFYKNRPKLLEHFTDKHKLCEHAHCRELDPMLRVFNSDFELQTHMQTAHGSNAKEISLEALGFRFGGGSATASSAPANTTRNTNGPVQTGANVVATFVKFDHVHRMDRVELEPTHRRNAGGKGRGKTNSTKAVSNPDPLPLHYLTSRQHFKPIMIDLEAEEKAPTSPASRTGDEVLVSKKRDSNNRRGGQERPAEHAERVKKNDVDLLRHLPSSLEERKRMLGEVANRLLGKGTNKHAQLARANEEYRCGRLFATEYYKLLRQLVPDERELNELFPLIAGTVEDNGKQTSLCTARSMLSCIEFQTQEKTRMEEEKKASEEKIIADLRSKRVNIGGGGGKRPSKNAWNAGSGASATPPATSPVSKGPQKPQGIWAQASGNSAAAASSAMASAPSLGSAFMDPSDFPSLATNAPNRRWPTSAGSQKPGPKRGNAWFGK